jgi:hypothetical protein
MYDPGVMVQTAGQAANFIEKWLPRSCVVVGIVLGGGVTYSIHTLFSADRGDAPQDIDIATLPTGCEEMLITSDGSQVISQEDIAIYHDQLRDHEMVPQQTVLSELEQRCGGASYNAYYKINGGAGALAYRPDAETEFTVIRIFDEEERSQEMPSITYEIGGTDGIIGMHYEVMQDGSCLKVDTHAFLSTFYAAGDTGVFTDPSLATYNNPQKDFTQALTYVSQNEGLELHCF